MYSRQLEKLRELEALRAISIGMDRNGTNNYFYATTLIGKLMNWSTNVLIVFLLGYLFINWKIGIILFFVLCVNAVLTQKIATTILRIKALSNEDVFDLLYKTRVIQIRENKTGFVYNFHNYHWAEVAMNVMNNSENVGSNEGKNQAKKKMSLAEKVVDAQRNPHKYNRSNFPD